MVFVPGLKQFDVNHTVVYKFHPGHSTHEALQHPGLCSFLLGHNAGLLRLLGRPSFYGSLALTAWVVTVKRSQPPVMWAGVTSEEFNPALILLCGLCQSALRWSAAQHLPDWFPTGVPGRRWPWCWRRLQLCLRLGACTSLWQSSHTSMTQNKCLAIATREACTCTFSHGCDSSDLPPHVPSLEHGRNTQASMSGSTRCHPVYISFLFTCPLLCNTPSLFFVALSPSGLLWSPAAVWGSNMFERRAPTPQRVPSSSSNKKVQRLTAAFRCHLLQALLSVKRPFRWHNNWSLKWNIDDINPQMCSVSVMLLSVATVKDLHNFIQF